MDVDREKFRESNFYLYFLDSWVDIQDQKKN